MMDPRQDTVSSPTTTTASVTTTPELELSPNLPVANVALARPSGPEVALSAATADLPMFSSPTMEKATGAEEMGLPAVSLTLTVNTTSVRGSPRAAVT